MRLDNYPLEAMADALGTTIGWTVAASACVLLGLGTGSWIGRHTANGGVLDVIQLNDAHVALATAAAALATVPLWTSMLVSASDSLRERLQTCLTILSIWMFLGILAGHFFFVMHGRIL